MLPSRCFVAAGLKCIQGEHRVAASGAQGQPAAVETVVAALAQRLVDSPSARRTLLAVLQEARPAASLLLYMAILQACEAGMRDLLAPHETRLTTSTLACCHTLSAPTWQLEHVVACTSLADLTNGTNIDVVVPGQVPTLASVAMPALLATRPEYTDAAHEQAKALEAAGHMSAVYAAAEWDLATVTPPVHLAALLAVIEGLPPFPSNKLQVCCQSHWMHRAAVHTPIVLLLTCLLSKAWCPVW